jgi:CRISPR-associated protein Csh1
MIEALKKIGDVVLQGSRDDFLDNLIEPVGVKGKDGESVYIGIIDFSLEKDRDGLDFAVEEMNEETPKKYLWLGNAETANSPQDRLTTNNVDYLLSQTIPNLIGCLPDGILKNHLTRIRDTFFYDLGEQKGAAKRYRFILNLSKLPGYCKDNQGALWDDGERKGAVNHKLMVKTVSQCFWNWIRETRGLSKKELRTFTIKINGADVRKFEDYKVYLLRKKQEDAFGKSRISVCHICGRGGQVSSDTTKLEFGYYITDKIGFSSELGGEKHFYKNLSFCKGCYHSLVIGESFTKNFLSTRLANQNVYIIPEFILPSCEDLTKWSNWLKTSFEAALKADHYKRFLEQAGNYNQENQSNQGNFSNQANFLINILFWQKSQAEFKVLKLIKAVSPSRLDVLRKVSSDISAVGKRLFDGKSTRWELWLNNMYYLFPVRADKRKNPYEFKKILDFYDALFTGRMVEHTFLIQQFLRLAKVCRYDQGEQFNLGKDGNGDQALVASILKANLLLLYLRRLSALKEGRKEVTDIPLEDFPEEVQTFIHEMGYNAEQVALFGLGILIGEIGSAQFNARVKNKPILEKINFQGMSTDRLVKFSNDVFANMRQYKRLSPENEKMFAGIKRLLDKRLHVWTSSAQQNVFYILSGYAYRTNKIMSSARNTESKEVKGETFKYGRYE